MGFGLAEMTELHSSSLWLLYSLLVQSCMFLCFFLSNIVAHVIMHRPSIFEYIYRMLIVSCIFKQRDTNGLTAENSELKLRLQTMEQQVHLQDGKHIYA